MIELLAGVVFGIALCAMIVLTRTLSKKIKELELTNRVEEKLLAIAFWAIVSSISFGGMFVGVVMMTLFRSITS